MKHLPIVGLLGAERQAAVSAALAWPERRFLFVSDQPVIDGWDLPNVTMMHADPNSAQALVNRTGVEWMPLCPRWLGLGHALAQNTVGSFALDQVLPWLRAKFGDVVLPVSARPVPGLKQIVKGNRWHRPDAPTISSQLASWPVEDPYGCGVCYQNFWPKARTVLAVGRRFTHGGIQLGLVAVHSEVCARDDVLGAGETIQEGRLVALTSGMLQHLGHVGYFTCNWLIRDEEGRLSSVRAAPRAVLGTLRRAGVDLLVRPQVDMQLARPGHKFTVQIHYATYQKLVA
jgi:hypothetical protein